MIFVEFANDEVGGFCHSVWWHKHQAFDLSKYKKCVNVEIEFLELLNLKDN
jgi:hypothetical protein